MDLLYVYSFLSSSLLSTDSAGKYLALQTLMLQCDQTREQLPEVTSMRVVKMNKESRKAKTQSWRVEVNRRAKIKKKTYCIYRI